MNSISNRYNDQVKQYRHENFGSSPGLLKKQLFALKSFFKLEKANNYIISDRTSLNNVRDQITSLNKRSIESEDDNISFHDFSNENHSARLYIPNSKVEHSELPIVSPEQFKADLTSNNLLKYSEGVFIRGDLDLSDMTELVLLPKTMFVEGNFNFSDMTNAKRLPEILYVDGNLIISDCQKLQELSSEEMQVTGSLIAKNCRHLTNITENIKIGRDINFKNCTWLNIIPRGIFKSGYTIDSTQRQINFEGTSVDPDWQQDWVLVYKPTENKYRKFHFSTPLEQLQTLCSKYTTATIEVPKKSTNLKEDQIISRWLSSSLSGYDFSNSTRTFKRNQAKRVLDILDRVANDQKSREVTLQIIQQFETYQTSKHLPKIEAALKNLHP